MTRDPGEIVSDGYDRIAERYLDWSAGSPLRLRKIAELGAALAPASRVLDLGCGAGAPLAPYLVERGHILKGIDGSRRQIELARRNEPRAVFSLADMTTVDYAANSYDAVTAFYSITHVPRALHLPLLTRIHDWLVPGGLLFASMGYDDVPSWTGDWLGSTMHFSHFDAATNLDLVEKAGFAIEHQEIAGEDENGHEVRFLWILARATSA